MQWLPHKNQDDESGGGENHESLMNSITKFLQGHDEIKRTPEQQVHLIESWLIENLSKVPMKEQQRVLWSIGDMNSILVSTYTPKEGGFP